MKNVVRINELNAQGSAVFAVNKFADMTPEEFAATHLITLDRSSIPDDLPKSTLAATDDIPDSWDW